ncbi:hypothetical protein CTAYLR_003341 [Chrysophaeum taylorii]|uniref:Methyltransferase domain-containing protein n=1 Tax=Chrysophaeum taylorii TaxID=2483200 RepID=A0AAD7XJ66_9STRA|nr:hypothetical protein CTAYLR_003341 [Chrysophaeum taylorii]
MNRSAVVVAAATLAALCAVVSRWWPLRTPREQEKKKTQKKTSTTTSTIEEETHAAYGLVCGAIEGALAASQLYIGDRLHLYATLWELCKPPGASCTVLDVAAKTRLNARWLREWLAQQAAMGVLVLEEGDGDGDADLRYRLTPAFANVLANEASPSYIASMLQCVPALVHRAKTMLPEAFASGRGRPYDDPDISIALDRAHAKHVRNVVLPHVVPATPALKLLEREGAKVADVGCGGGSLVIALASAFPNATVHGYEIADAALALATENVRWAQVRTASIRDARVTPLGDETYDVVTTFDVVHDAPDPVGLLRQVKRALKPDGVWLLADLVVHDTTRANITSNPGAATLFAFSTCLCLACSLQTPDGRGLGTCGFGTAVANTMLAQAGFTRVRVILEEEGTRWFEVRH